MRLQIRISGFNLQVSQGRFSVPCLVISVKTLYRQSEVQPSLLFTSCFLRKRSTSILSYTILSIGKYHMWHAFLRVCFCSGHSSFTLDLICINSPIPSTLVSGQLSPNYQTTISKLYNCIRFNLSDCYCCLWSGF